MSRNERQTRTAPFQIRLLNHLQPVCTGTLIPYLTSAPLRSLLTYPVLFADVPQSRRRLAFLFRPDATERQARTHLSHALHNLIQAVTPASRPLQPDTRTVRRRFKALFYPDVAGIERAAA